MFSSNKKYKWLTFILKYGEDDYVKYYNINEKTFLEKTALSRKNKFYFSNFFSKGKYNIARTLIRYFCTNIGNFDIFFKVTAIF
jgi:hypothetical protein